MENKTRFVFFIQTTKFSGKTKFGARKNGDAELPSPEKHPESNKWKPVRFWYARQISPQKYVCPRLGNMGSRTKLEVMFASDCILDAQHLHEFLCQHYTVDYTGLFDCGTHMSVYLQTAERNGKMAPRTIFRLCEDFGALAVPQTFKRRRGMVVSEVGKFKNPGPQKGSRNKTANSAGDLQMGSTVNKRKCSALETEPTRSDQEESTHSDEEELTHSDQEPCDEPEEEPDADPLFIPVYSGFNRDWKIESWNRSTTDFKRPSSSKFRARVLDRQDHKCNYCGCDVSFGDYSNADMDHVIPLKAGGTNTLHNVQVLCTPDHRKKTALECRRVSIALSVMMDAAFVPNEVV